MGGTAAPCLEESLSGRSVSSDKAGPSWSQTPERDLRLIDFKKMTPKYGTTVGQDPEQV